MTTIYFPPATPSFVQPPSDPHATYGFLVNSKPGVEMPREVVVGGLQAKALGDDNPLPEEWNFYTHEPSGKTYYQNHKTGEVTWIRPKMPPPAPPPQPLPLPVQLQNLQGELLKLRRQIQTGEKPVDPPPDPPPLKEFDLVVENGDVSRWSWHTVTDYDIDKYRLERWKLGKTYYYCQETKEQTWVDPRVQAAADAKKAKKEKEKADKAAAEKAAADAKAAEVKAKAEKAVAEAKAKAEKATAEKAAAEARAAAAKATSASVDAAAKAKAAAEAKAKADNAAAEKAAADLKAAAAEARFAEAKAKADGLPAGWKAGKDQNGNEYYYNKELNCTQWDRPRLPVPMTRPEAAAAKEDKAKAEKSAAEARAAAAKATAAAAATSVDAAAKVKPAEEAKAKAENAAAEKAAADLKAAAAEARFAEAKAAAEGKANAEKADELVEALPAGWKAGKDQHGNQYYYNKELNRTQWDRPQVPPAPGPIAPDPRGPQISASFEGIE